MYRNGIKGIAVSDRPRCTNLCLHVGDEYVGDKVVACHAGENGVDVVLVDRGGVLHIIREDSRFDADVGYVVELGDDTVPVVGSCKAVGFMYFWAEMAEKKDSWLVWADEDGANEDFKVFHHFLTSMREGQHIRCIINKDIHVRRVIGVKLYNDEVCNVWEVMRIAETEVTSIGSAHGSIGEF